MCVCARLSAQSLVANDRPARARDVLPSVTLVADMPQMLSLISARQRGSARFLRL